jgi:hypothetical protein
MKWIKVFEDFESNEDKIEDLIQLCLVELTDNNFKVEVQNKEFPRVFKSSAKDILISKIGVLERDKLFDYKTVKDHLITFVKLLSKDYEIDHIFFMGGWKKKSWLDKKMIVLTGTQSNSRERKEVSVEDLVSDKVKINFEIISITVKIKK